MTGRSQLCSALGRGSKAGTSFLAQGQKEGRLVVVAGPERRAGRGVGPGSRRAWQIMVEAFQVTGEISSRRGR